MIYCEKCNCSTWAVHTTPNESGFGIIHGVSNYRYCPNCKKIYEVKLVNLSSEKMPEEGS